MGFGNITLSGFQETQQRFIFISLMDILQINKQQFSKPWINIEQRY